MESREIASSDDFLSHLKDPRVIKWWIEKPKILPIELKIRIDSDNRDVRNAISSIDDIMVLNIKISF